MNTLSALSVMPSHNIHAMFRQTHTEKMTYAKTSDAGILHISNAANGLSCNAMCIECGKPLVAKQGQILDWHFAHAVDASCKGYTPETLVHFRAKHLFADAIKQNGLYSMLPSDVFNFDFYKDDPDDDDYGRIWVYGAYEKFGIVLLCLNRTHPFKQIIPNKNCCVEVEGKSPCGTYRPDVAVYPKPSQWNYDNPPKHYGHRELNLFEFTSPSFTGVEFVVSSDISAEKEKKIRDANDISIRVPLNPNWSDVNDDALMEKIKSSASFFSYGEGHLPTVLLNPKEKQIEACIEKWLKCQVYHADIEFFYGKEQITAHIEYV